MVFAVSLGNTASASPALLGVFSPCAMTGILQESLLGCPFSLHNGCPSASQETHKRNKSDSSQPYTGIPGLLSASPTLSYVGDPEASHLALQDVLKRQQSLLY